jgi:hypothetical protein
MAKTNRKNKLKKVRDKAFTYMKEAVDEIRIHGQYVFWKDEQRFKGYVSRYHKNKSRNRIENKEVTN